MVRSRIECTSIEGQHRAASVEDQRGAIDVRRVTRIAWTIKTLDQLLTITWWWWMNDNGKMNKIIWINEYSVRHHWAMSMRACASSDALPLWVVWVMRTRCFCLIVFNGIVFFESGFISIKFDRMKNFSSWKFIYFWDCDWDFNYFLICEWIFVTSILWFLQHDYKF